MLAKSIGWQCLSTVVASLYKWTPMHQASWYSHPCPFHTESELALWLTVTKTCGRSDVVPVPAICLKKSWKFLFLSCWEPLRHQVRSCYSERKTTWGHHVERPWDYMEKRSLAILVSKWTQPSSHSCQSTRHVSESISNVAGLATTWLQQHEKQQERPTE